jgi:cytochrome c556
MRHGLIVLTIGFTLAMTWTLHAAEKPTPEHAQAMKDLLAVVQTMTKPGAYEDFELAKKNATSAKAAYETVTKYWESKGEKEAKLVKDGIMAATDITANANKSSVEGVTAAVTALRATCAPCHMVHRTQLPDGTFEIK